MGILLVSSPASRYNSWEQYLGPLRRHSRVLELENLLISRLAEVSGRETREEFLALDQLLERIGDGADRRLAFQAAFPLESAAGSAVRVAGPEELRQRCRSHRANRRKQGHAAQAPGTRRSPAPGALRAARAARRGRPGRRLPRPRAGC